MPDVRERNVMATIRLKVQLVKVDILVQKARDHIGYISELTVQGIGAIPAAKETKYAESETIIVHDIGTLVGQYEGYQVYDEFPYWLHFPVWENEEEFPKARHNPGEEDDGPGSWQNPH